MAVSALNTGGRDDCLAWLMERIKENGFDLRVEDLPARVGGFSSWYDQAIFINRQWQDRPEFPFLLAHELGHLLNGDREINYFTMATVRLKSERQANLIAIELMREFARDYDLRFAGPYQFAANFGIPADLDYLLTSSPNPWRR